MQHVILVQFLLSDHHTNIGLYNRPKRAGFLIGFSAGAVAVDIIFKAFLISQAECPSHYYTPAIIFIIKHATFEIQRCRPLALLYKIVAYTSFERTDHSQIRKTPLRKSAAALVCCHFQRNVCDSRTKTTTKLSRSKPRKPRAVTGGRRPSVERGVPGATWRPKSAKT